MKLTHGPSTSCQDDRRIRAAGPTTHWHIDRAAARAVAGGAPQQATPHGGGVVRCCLLTTRCSLHLVTLFRIAPASKTRSHHYSEIVSSPPRIQLPSRPSPLLARSIVLHFGLHPELSLSSTLPVRFAPGVCDCFSLRHRTARTPQQPSLIFLRSAIPNPTSRLAVTRRRDSGSFQPSTLPTLVPSRYYKKP